MLTEGWTLVVVDFESVWHVDLESLLVEHGLSTIDRRSCALGYHFIDALLVNRCITLSALVALLVQPPDKFMADRAERGLREKGGCELVTLDVVDFGLFDGASAVMQRKESFVLKFTHVLCVWRERVREQEIQ